MLRKRLIFTLLVENGRFMLSRNFTLQAVGDLSWLRSHYDFDAIAFAIDELVILSVDRARRDLRTFARVIEELGETCFMPFATGGGVRSVEDARLLLNAGADKIVVNTPLFTMPTLVRDLVDRFGSQCVVGSIDYRRTGEESRVFCENGTRDTGMSLPEAVALAESLGCGELYLTSIQRDGTGQGLDVEYLSRIAEVASVPVILSGGAGHPIHLSQGIRWAGVSAVSTAHLFNFIADSLTDAREMINQDGTPLAIWAKLRRLV
jgi:cyclase